MVTVTITVAISILLTSLPEELLFFSFGRGAEAKLFGVKHRGQVDKNDSYL